MVSEGRRTAQVQQRDDLTIVGPWVSSSSGRSYRFFQEKGKYVKIEMKNRDGSPGNLIFNEDVDIVMGTGIENQSNQPFKIVKVLANPHGDFLLLHTPVKGFLDTHYSVVKVWPDGQWGVWQTINSASVVDQFYVKDVVELDAAGTPELGDQVVVGFKNGTQAVRNFRAGTTKRGAL